MTEAHEKAAKLLYLIWRHIDFDSMSRSRLMGIYDEFMNKAKYAAYSSRPEQFLETICRKMGISSLSKPEILPLLTSDVISVIRDDTRTVVLLMRAMIEENRKIVAKEEKKQMKETTKRLLEEHEREFSKLLEEVE